MGIALSWYSSSGGEPQQGENSTFPREKRRLEEDDLNESAESDASILYTPQKKKLKSTSEYIYQVLFVDGETSDVTIRALGEQWKLHKLYLRQCGFFESMFSGCWKESEQSTISLDIPDENIDAEALTIAFGCLYRDNFTIEPVKVIPVLAAASLLQLDGLMQQCSLIMTETISLKTVCEYHNAAKMYGLQMVEDCCLEWLLNNIMCKQSSALLKAVSPQLMESLVTSPDLFVMQVEMDVYNLLKRWLFLQVCPSWTGNYKTGVTRSAELHFTDTIVEEFGVDSEKSYLETTSGGKYQEVFSTLRFEHILIDLASTRLIAKDNIIPKVWLAPFYEKQWYHLMTIEQTEDEGPTSDQVTDHSFLKRSLRCARVLPKESEYQWRWIGFNYGIDLVIMFGNRMLIFKRNSGNQARLLSAGRTRHIMFRLTVSCLNEMGQLVFRKSTGVKSHQFAKDEEVIVMHLKDEKKLTFPLRISLNVLYYTPTNELTMPNLLSLCPTNCNQTSSPPHVTLSTMPSTPNNALNEQDDTQADSSADESEPVDRNFNGGPSDANGVIVDEYMVR